MVMQRCGVHDPDLFPDSCHVRVYRRGRDALGWHADDEQLFKGQSGDAPSVSLSVGATRTFAFRLTNNKVEKTHVVSLSAGDAMVVDGRMQEHYVHSIPRDPSVNGIRVNFNVKGRHAIADFGIKTRCHGSRRPKLRTTKFSMQRNIGVTRIAFRTEALDSQMIIGITLGVQIRSISSSRIRIQSPRIGIRTKRIFHATISGLLSDTNVVFLAS